jgi:SpoVK/Ycf46/Vps4 family AAA+-type ATPase
MAAEAIGFDIGKPLKVVNVAELVSKWVGETGKNLQSVFDDAKKVDAVLVFDEAEGLFGRRDSSGSTSRHDTLNVGLLLQLIENFSGVCIVITNLRDMVDPAFFRRFRFILEFEKPKKELRRAIWGKALPKELPLTADVNLDILAERFELSGGDIKSVVLRTATRAALRPAPSRVVGMKDLIDSCQEEVKKASEGPSDGARTMYL